MIKSQKPYPFSLIEDIFGEDYETTGIYFPGLSEAFSLLTPAEADILQKRYRDKMTFQAIATVRKVTRERIRQIEAKALRKMRYPARTKMFKAVSLKQLEEQTQKYKKLSTDYKILMEMYENISKSTATKENPVDINKAKNILSVPIEELDLSMRSYNCLKRAEKTTVSDLLKLNYEDLLRIRNLGAKSAEEIRNRLKEHGIELKEGRSDE